MQQTGQKYSMGQLLTSIMHSVSKPILSQACESTSDEKNEYQPAAPVKTSKNSQKLQILCHVMQKNHNDERQVANQYFFKIYNGKHHKAPHVQIFYISKVNDIIIQILIRKD